MPRTSRSRSSSSARSSSSGKGPGPRPLWKGAISFGLVSIPIRLASAVRDRSIHFHRVTSDGTCRLRQKLVCPDTGKEYDFGQTAKGYEIAPHQYVIVDKDELESVKPQAGAGIDIVQFVEMDEIDPIYFDHAYYLIPDGKNTKAYELLRRVLLDTNKGAIAKFVMHAKEYLVIIRAGSKALWLQTLHFEDEIVPADSIASTPHTQVSAGEMKLAMQLIETLSRKFDPGEYRDEYKERLQELLESKDPHTLADQKLAERAEEERSRKKPQVLDLMSRLKESLKNKGLNAEENHEQRPRTRQKRGKVIDHPRRGRRAA